MKTGSGLVREAVGLEAGCPKRTGFAVQLGTTRGVALYRAGRCAPRRSHGMNGFLLLVALGEIVPQLFDALPKSMM